jgi:hypothetical protein
VGSAEHVVTHHREFGPAAWPVCVVAADGHALRLIQQRRSIMADQARLPEALQFRPRWWWDPVPDWLFPYLDKEVVIEIAKIQLEFQQVVLAKQLEMMDRSLKLIGGGR